MLAQLMAVKELDWTGGNGYIHLRLILMMEYILQLGYSYANVSSCNGGSEM